ncbi:MAG: TadE/TadG family type IV pilus assembly protein [Candidatus Humimicrobiaceae bacterium]
MKKIQNIKYFLKKDCGSALLEFALIAPVLFLLFAGIVQFGFIINAKVVVNSASYEGARAATMSDDPESGAAQAVLDYASASIPGWNLGSRLEIETNNSGNNPGDEVTVKVTYYVPVFFSNIVSLPDSSQMSVCGESTMQIEEKE